MSRLSLVGLLLLLASCGSHGTANQAGGKANPAEVEIFWPDSGVIETRNATVARALDAGGAQLPSAPGPDAQPSAEVSE